MRYQAIWAGLLMSGVAGAQTPPNNAGPTRPAATQPARHRSGSDDAQLFIAPSGEPFRAGELAPYPSASWFARADLNHDGKVDEGEFVSDFLRYFDSLDVRHAGMLGPDEIKHYETDIVPEVQSGDSGDGGFFGDGIGSGPGGHGGKGHGGHHGSHDGDSESDDGASEASSEASPNVGQSSVVEHDLKGDHPTGGGRFGLINIPEPIASMDTTFSGHVSRADAQAAAQRRFALLDPEGKGYITIRDLPQTWVQARYAKRAEKAARRR